MRRWLLNWDLFVELDWSDDYYGFEINEYAIEKAKKRWNKVRSKYLQYG